MMHAKSRALWQTAVYRLHTSVTDYHVNAQSDWLHRCRLLIDRRHLELLKMASPSRFREVCEEDVQNVSQSAIPKKKKKKESYKVWNKDFQR